MTTLTDAEVYRIKAELGFHVLGVGAEVYIGTRSIFSVIRDNVSGSDTAATTSTTNVTAAGAATLTLASVTGLAAGQRVQLDADGQRETSTIQVVSGSTIRVLCRKTHAQPYLVELESPLTMVRGMLSDLTRIEQGDYLAALDVVGLKQVDQGDVVWKDGADVTALLDRARGLLQARLAKLCGIYSMWLAQNSAGDSVEVY